VPFVKSLGCYDEVVTYDAVTSLPADSPVAYVDMAGNSGLREKLHRHFGDQMKYSGLIGLTHRSSSPDEPELPGAKPIWFFAPDQIRKRAREWGPGGVDAWFGAAWAGFAPNLDEWLTVIEGRAAAVRRSIPIPLMACRRIRAYPLFKNTDISLTPFLRRPNGYRLAEQESATLTAGDEAACLTRRTIPRSLPTPAGAVRRGAYEIRRQRAEDAAPPRQLLARRAGARAEHPPHRQRRKAI
jgi:hypothetical protein